jgi:hypothetical protein
VAVIFNPVLIKLGLCSQILLKPLVIALHKNPFRNSQIVIGGHTDVTTVIGAFLQMSVAKTFVKINGATANVCTGPPQ